MIGDIFDALGSSASGWSFFVVENIALMILWATGRVYFLPHVQLLLDTIEFQQKTIDNQNATIDRYHGTLEVNVQALKSIQKVGEGNHEGD